MAVSKKTTNTVVPPVQPAPTVQQADPAVTTVQQADPAVPTVQQADPAVNNAEGVSQSGEEVILTPEQIAANQAAADAAFKAANDGAKERIAKEEAIPSMTPEELQAEFGWTVPEAISVLRDAISRSQSIHKDKMNDHLDKIEATAQL